jgi:hypothetical protein
LTRKLRKENRRLAFDCGYRLAVAAMGMQTDSALEASGVKPDVTRVLSCGGSTVGTKTA